MHCYLGAFYFLNLSYQIFKLGAHWTCWNLLILYIKNSKLETNYVFNTKTKFYFKLNSYGKCYKISNTFLFLFSNKMLVFRAGIYKFLVRVANREDPNQTASSEAV